MNTNKIKMIIAMLLSMIITIIIGLMVIIKLEGTLDVPACSGTVHEMNIRYHEPSAPPSYEKKAIEPIEIDESIYDCIETRNDTVIQYTNEITAKYENLDPLLVQALIFYESSNNPNATNGQCKGYMQIYEKYHIDRMEKLGVADIFDGYGNILVGCDYLSYLINRYGDVSLALMKYNGDSRAESLYSRGEMSSYASNILSLQENLRELEDWSL